MTYNSLDPKPITRRTGTARIEATPTAAGTYRIYLDSTEDPRTANIGIVHAREDAKAVVAFLGNQLPNVIEAMRTAALEEA